MTDDKPFFTADQFTLNPNLRDSLPQELADLCNTKVAPLVEENARLRRWIEDSKGAVSLETAKEIFVYRDALERIARETKKTFVTSIALDALAKGEEMK